MSQANVALMNRFYERFLTTGEIPWDMVDERVEVHDHDTPDQGEYQGRAGVQRWLQDWILQYVDGDPAHSSESTKARKPLAAAEVIVEEIEGNPGFYSSKFFLRPHYQLEGLTVSLRLVSKLPSAKAA